MNYVLRRAGVALLVLFLAVTLNFVVIRAAPGEYRSRMADQQASVLTEEDRKEIRASYGLNDPVGLQFVRYLGQTLQGNFGKSFADGQPVRDKLWAAAKNSVEMVLVGVIAGMLLGITLGVVAGAVDRRWLGGAIAAIALLVYSLPAQWIGMVLLALLAGIFPIGGREDPFSMATGFWNHYADVLWHMALPSATLALITFGAYTLVAQSSVRKVMDEDFVLTARAKGFSPIRIVTHEVLRNAVLPIVALAALTLGTIWGGALLVEIVFSWPGLGSLAYDSISARDYPVIQATFLVFTVGVVVMNFLADCLYGVLDPRVRSR